MVEIKSSAKLIIERKAFVGDKVKLRLSVDQCVLAVESLSDIKDFIHANLEG